jgi:ADP-ribose pyrophosphatase YjhB (NUDIX family)
MPMSPYVAKLRALVGNDPLHLPTTCVLCRDEQDRLLLVRQRESGRWSLPGGAIEPGERPDDAARREALEESGIEVEITGLAHALGGPEYVTTYANGDVLSYVALVYTADRVGGVLEPDGDEIDQVGWFSSAELRELPLENFPRLLVRDDII